MCGIDDVLAYPKRAEMQVDVPLLAFYIWSRVSKGVLCCSSLMGLTTPKAVGEFKRSRRHKCNTAGHGNGHQDPGRTVVASIHPSIPCGSKRLANNLMWMNDPRCKHVDLLASECAMPVARSGPYQRRNLRPRSRETRLQRVEAFEA